MVRPTTIVLGSSHRAVALAAAAVALLLPSALAGCPFHAQFGTTAGPSPHASRATAEADQALWAAAKAKAHGSVSSTSTGGKAAVGDTPGGHPWMPQNPFANNASDPLVVANNMFHTVYTQAGDLMSPSTVMMLQDDYLVLYDSRGNRYVELVVPAAYHNLKMVAHIPFAVFLIIWPDLSTIPAAMANHSAPAQLSAATLDTLAKYNATVAAAEADPGFLGRFTPGAQRDRQLRITAGVRDTIDSVLASKSISVDALYSMTFGLFKNYISQNAVEAATSELEAIHKAVLGWKANQLTSEEWDAMWVVSTVSHMARRNNLVTQYFARLFNVSQMQSERMIAIESISDEDSAMKLLNTHMTDYATGTAFFNERYRMHEDLLADAAREVLDDIFGPAPPRHDDDLNESMMPHHF